MPRYRWIEPTPLDHAGYELADNLLLSEILARRGLGDPGAVAAYLAPSLDTLIDPLSLPDLALARDLTLRAVERGERIAIFGDYDVDGLTSTALLVRLLRAVGADVVPYIPHRIDDGYGLKLDAVRCIITEGASLLITVDNGTSSAAELAEARRAGLDTIVLDHHAVDSAGDYSWASAFVSPMRPDARLAFRGFAAVGVAYQLARVVAGDSAAAGLLPLVALGTVADIVPLISDNRTLVAVGLERFDADAPVGLRALAAESGIDLTRVTSWDCGFVLGPRINAAGRIGNPLIALNLLLTDAEDEARALARELNRINSERQAVADRMLAEAEHELQEHAGELPPVLVLARDDWGAGVVGLVASRLVDRYGRPAVVLARNGAIGRGSARSIDGFNISEALSLCDDMLIEHGGHSKAAGLTVEAARVGELEKRLGALVCETLGPELPAPPLRLDAELSVRELTIETAHVLRRLEPVGHGNPAPIFLLRNVRPRAARLTRDGAHVQFEIADAEGRRGPRAIYFRAGAQLPTFTSGLPVDLAVSLRAATWQGREQLTVEVVDVRPATVREHRNSAR